jgi:hypothetical protein
MLQVEQWGEDDANALRRGQAATQVDLARRLLSFAQAPLADERAAIMQDWVGRFGFQPDNVSNQLEHLSSLIVSYGASNGGDYGRAVDALHTKLLAPVEQWRAHVRLADNPGSIAHRGRPATPMARLYGAIDGSPTYERRDQVNTRPERRIPAARRALAPDQVKPAARPPDASGCAASPASAWRTVAGWREISELPPPHVCRAIPMQV